MKKNELSMEVCSLLELLLNKYEELYNKEENNLKKYIYLKKMEDIIKTLKGVYNNRFNMNCLEIIYGMYEGDYNALKGGLHEK